jgi:hypothetical protein
MSYQSIYVMVALACIVAGIAIVQIAQHLPAALERQAVIDQGDAAIKDGTENK